jgi:hypothetical protein
VRQQRAPLLSATPRGSRSKTRTPTCASSAAICRETADWVKPRRWAAAVIELYRATVWNTSSSWVSMSSCYLRMAPMPDIRWSHAGTRSNVAAMTLLDAPVAAAAMRLLNTATDQNADVASLINLETR